MLLSGSVGAGNLRNKEPVSKRSAILTRRDYEECPVLEHDECSQVESYRHFGEIYCLHLQVQRLSQENSKIRIYISQKRLQTSTRQGVKSPEDRRSENAYLL
jgi:hypothetical protein